MGLKEWFQSLFGAASPQHKNAARESETRSQRRGNAQDAIAIIRERDGDVVKTKGTEVVAVEFIGSPVTDADLELLSNLKQLKSLNLFECGGVTDTGLAHLYKLTNLVSLDLQGTAITDDGLAHLRMLTKLRALSLFGTRVSDPGLVHLQNLTNLEQLGVHNTGVSNAGIDSLKKALPKLKKVLT